jgi:hypothetical protein
VSRRQTQRAVIVAATLACLLAGAWFWQRQTEATPRTGSGAAVYSIAVYRGDRLVARFSIADLRRLPQTSFLWDGKAQSGPALTALLAAAGAKEYAQVLISGMALHDDGRLRLTAAQARAGVVISFNKRGTVKACGPKLSWKDWVRDVTAIRVD